jgi:glycosyltransferase involved in cell wall biosynthesis
MTASRPRLVFVSPVPPSQQSTSGFSARVHHFVCAAVERMDVTLVLIRMPGYDGSLESAQSSIDERIRVHRLDAPAPPWADATMKGRLLRGLVQYPFDPLPFDCYPHSWPRLREVLAGESPAAVAFYLPVLAHLAEHAPAGVPVIGVLEEGWERLVDASLDGSRKNAWFARREATRFATVYRRLDKRASAVVAISEEERDWFRRTIDPEKIVVIPNGIDMSYFTPHDPADRDIDVLVVGDLRSPRNYVGALSTWEAARDMGWRWTFVGTADDAVAAALRAGGAEVAGAVGDVRPFYGRARAVLVPALDGTGVKSTTIQAWAMQRPLVASPVGARGLPARPGENILVGDDAAAMVQHLARLLAEPAEAERIAARGHATAQQHNDLAVIARQFAELCFETAQDAAPLVSPA